jgi:hypothetical protein
VFYRSWEEIEQRFSRFFEIESYTQQQLAWHLVPRHNLISRILKLLMRHEWAMALISRLQYYRAGRAIVCKLKCSPSRSVQLY